MSKYFTIDKDEGVASVRVKFIGLDEYGEFDESTAVYLTDSAPWPTYDDSAVAGASTKICEIIVQLKDGYYLRQPIRLGPSGSNFTSSNNLHGYTSKTETENYYYYYWNTDDAIIYASTSTGITLEIETAKQQFVIYINNDSHTTVTTISNDYGRTYTNGDMIECNEILDVTITATEGFVLNNTEFVGGTIIEGYDSTSEVEIKRRIQVNKEDITITAESSPVPYTLTLITSTGAIVTFERLESPSAGAFTGYLQSGDTVFYDDVCRLVIGAEDGYDVITKITSGDQTAEVVGYYEDEGLLEITDDLIIQSVAVSQFFLTIDAGANTVIKVRRTKSDIEDAFCGLLQNGDIVYYNDELSIDYEVSTGYKCDGFNISHQFAQETYEISRYGSHNVTFSFHFVNSDGDVVDATAFTDRNLIISSDAATLKQFKLKELGMYRELSGQDIVEFDVMLERTSSPLAGASIGAIEEGGTVYALDVLKPTIKIVNFIGYAAPLFRAHYVTINVDHPTGYADLFWPRDGESFVVDEEDLYLDGSEIEIFIEGGAIYTPDGFVFIDNGAGFDKYLVCIDNGTSWDQYVMCIANGASWDSCI